MSLPNSTTSSTRFTNSLVVLLEKCQSSCLLAIRSLWLRKMRAFLSVLGIIIGTSAVIALMAFGEGSMQDALEDIKRQGATNIILRSVKPPDKANANNKGSWVVAFGLTDKDYSALDTLPTIKLKVPMRIFPQEVRTPGHMVLGRVVATNQNYHKVNQFKMAAGRFLTDADEPDAYGDNSQLKNVAVLGANVADELFPFENPLGQDVLINKIRYVVIGVIADRMPLGSSAGGKSSEDFNDDVYIPYHTAESVIGEKMMLRQAGGRYGEDVDYHQITVMVGEMSEVRPTGKAIQDILERNHLDKQDWSITIPLDRLEEAERAKARYQMLLFLIASISLLVGGIGIMNIMLATVTERTREIGIRRALGAKRRDITLQFLVEAVVQTSVGGVLGVILGLAVVFGIPFLCWHLLSTRLPSQLHVPSIFLALGVSIGVGMLFGWDPARRASRLDPIEALRHV
jgi:putative ABC transport system permease protein